MRCSECLYDIVGPQVQLDDSAKVLSGCSVRLRHQSGLTNFNSERLIGATACQAVNFTDTDHTRTRTTPSRRRARGARRQRRGLCVVWGRHFLRIEDDRLQSLSRSFPGVPEGTCFGRSRSPSFVNTKRRLTWIPAGACPRMFQSAAGMTALMDYDCGQTPQFCFRPAPAQAGAKWCAHSQPS